MTIIGGFRVQDGILVFSDTEWSGGVKVYQQKIFPHFFRGGAVAFAVAGNEATAKMAIEDCKDALTLARKRAYRPREVKAIIRDAVRSICEKYVDTRPSKAERELADFQLILACILKPGLVQLSSSLGPSVLPVDRFTCQGVGWDVGHHIMERGYDPNMRIKDAVIVAIQALGAAKRQAPNIGGQSQFLVMGEQFVSGLVGHDPVETERLILEYENAAERLLLRAGYFDLNEGAFKEKVLNFEQLVTNLRAEWASTAAPYRELIEGLAKPASGG